MLADVDGVVFVKALEHLTGRRDPEASEEPQSSLAADPTPKPTFEQACAGALVELCSTYLDAAGDAARATVVVHVDAERFTESGTGIAALDDGPMIAGQTALRLACDCHHELVVEGPDRVPIGIGRRSRQIPGWLWRVLKHRDHTCRFPGCNRARWVQGHHIVRWTKDGPTDADNLVLFAGSTTGWSTRGAGGSRATPTSGSTSSTPRATRSPPCRRRRWIRSCGTACSTCSVRTGPPDETGPPREGPPRAGPAR